MKSLIELGFKISFVPRIPIPHPTPEFAPLYFLKLKVNCPKSLQLL